MPEVDRPAIRVAAGVLMDADGQVLIAQRPADKHAGGAWEFPGGKLQPGETSREALARELREELGVEISRAAPLIEYTHHYPHLDVTLCVFRVLVWRNAPRGLESQPLRWVAVDRLLDEGLLSADRPIVRALENLNRS